MRSHNEINTLNAILKSDEYPNIRVINEPTEIILDEKKFLFVPWMHNSHFGEYLTQIEQSTADILCAHLEMQGFVMHAGVMSADGLEAKTFEQFDRVLTGHYHAKSTRNNVTYLGTAYDTSWADVMDRKFFHIYDTIDDSLSPIEYNERLFVRLVYNDATQESLVIPKNLKGKFVKLIVRSKTDVLNFETRLNQITSQEPFELSVVDETVLLGDTSFEVSDSSIADTTQVINDTIDSLTDTESVDKDRLKILMQELYQDAIRDAISEE
jgi:DNA repair exonuclease SbcCD nuclease subunit